MYTITKDFTFSAAHRLEGHPKCGRLHGHNYTVRITVGSPVLVGGMVMDFTDLKRVYNDAIQEKVDHRYLVSRNNLESGDKYAEVAPNGDVCVLAVQHTTAEEMAGWIVEQMTLGLHLFGFQHIVVISVRLWETPTSFATCIGGSA